MKVTDVDESSSESWDTVARRRLATVSRRRLATVSQSVASVARLRPCRRCDVDVLSGGVTTDDWEEKFEYEHKCFP